MSQSERATGPKQAYWRAHLRLLVGCLLVWFLVPFGCGIVLADALNSFTVGNVPLGFWFAQQGSIYAFLLLIVFYSWRIGRLEARLKEQLAGQDTSNSSEDH